VFAQSGQLQGVVFEETPTNLRQFKPASAYQNRKLDSCYTPFISMTDGITTISDMRVYNPYKSVGDFIDGPVSQGFNAVTFESSYKSINLPNVFGSQYVRTNSNNIVGNNLANFGDGDIYRFIFTNDFA